MPRLTLGSSSCDSMKLHCLMLLCKMVTTRWMLPCRANRRGGKRGGTRARRKCQRAQRVNQSAHSLLSMLARWRE